MTAKETKGRATPASGSRWHSKGDVRTEKFLIECKTTEKDCYRLSAKTWEKIANEALRDGMKEPVMRIDLRTKFGDTVAFAVCDGLFLDGHPDVTYKGEQKSYLLKADCIDAIVSVGLIKHRVSIMPWKELLPVIQSASKERGCICRSNQNRQKALKPAGFSSP